MLRRHPRSKRTDPLYPYPTLFRYFEVRQRDEPPGQRAGVAVQLLPGDGEILARVHSVSHSFRGHSFRGTNDDATPAEARRAILEIRLALARNALSRATRSPCAPGSQIGRAHV